MTQNSQIRYTWDTREFRVLQYLLPFIFNPLTHSCLEISLTDVLWTFDTFEYNFGMNHIFKKYLKENCELGSDEHYSFKYFTKNALVTKI